MTLVKTCQCGAQYQCYQCKGWRLLPTNGNAAVCPGPHHADSCKCGAAPDAVTNDERSESDG